MRTVAISVDETLVEFDPTKMKTFKAVYVAAEQAGRASFNFDGHEYLVTYAKYLIEFLELEFGVVT